MEIQQEGGRTKPSELSFVWRASEYEHRDREAHWYWIIGTISVVLILLALKQGNYFFGVFILLASLLLLMHFKTVPAEYDFSIDKNGVRCGKHSVYEFKDLHSFAVREREGKTDVLILRQTKKYSMYIKIPINKEVTEKARRFLGARLEEFEYNETLSDTVSDVLGL